MELNARSIKLGLLAVVLVAGGYFAYRYWNRVDYARLADQQVAEEWLVNRERVPALPFFAEGGHYIDDAEALESEQVDRTVVVPLIERLQNEAGMSWQVLLDELRPGYAYAILAEIPRDAAQIEAMERVVAEEEAKFEGIFIEQRGYRWLSYEFIPPSAAPLFRSLQE